MLPFSLCFFNSAQEIRVKSSFKNFSLEMSWKSWMASFSRKNGAAVGADKLGGRALQSTKGLQPPAFGDPETRELLWSFPSLKSVSFSYIFTYCQSKCVIFIYQICFLVLDATTVLTMKTLFIYATLSRRVSINPVDGSILQHYGTEIEHRAYPSQPWNVRRKHRRKVTLKS